MTARPGDILKVYSAKKFVWHFGIYAGNGMIIDHAPRNGAHERTWDEFSEGEDVYIVPREHDDLPREEILRRARLNLGRWAYNMFNSNCEHFINWCRKGKLKSKQVLTIGAIIIGLILAIFFGARYLLNKR